jgi:uncharacterized protein
MLKRTLEPTIKRDLEDKIVILSGPRQCGKTTLSKRLLKSYQYINFDFADDRSIISSLQWDRKVDLLIFDELHKMKKWKAWLKGVYDKEGVRPRLLVTGSARMNQFRKTGDSLAGRHFSYRLHPFDLNELKAKTLTEQNEIFETLMRFGGFPEPYLKGSKAFYNRWSDSHLDIILRQDLLDLELIRDLKSMEILISLLAERVGTPISNASLGQLLQKDPKTIHRWLEILEDLYVIFRVQPYHKNLARAIRKEPKYYFYDLARVKGDDGVRYENLVASSLLKEVQRLQDTAGVRCNLHYLKTKQGKEIDFLVYFEESPSWLIEAKMSDSELSKNFRHFETHFKNSHRVQLVANLKQDRSTPEGHLVVKAAPWLSQLQLTTD